MSARGDMGATWGDGPPERIIRVPMQVTAADLADPDAFGARLEAALDAADPGGTLPVTVRMDVGALADADPALADGLRRLALDLEHATGDGSPFADPSAETLAMLRGAADRLERLEREEGDP